MQISCCLNASERSPYSGKLSSEKTFVNFTVLWLFAKAFESFPPYGDFLCADGRTQMQMHVRKCTYTNAEACMQTNADAHGQTQTIVKFFRYILCPSCYVFTP